MPVSERAPELQREGFSDQEKIRQRAYELYLQRGGRPGSELNDWLRAEGEFLQAQDKVVDEASEESFPASDPPAY